jgi:microcystin-dependent protein
MPRTLGIFSLVPSYLATSGATIKTEQHNPPLEDIAQALTDSLPRDGSAPMTGALAMGSNKITGLATGTDAGDAVRFDQISGLAPKLVQPGDITWTARSTPASGYIKANGATISRTTYADLFAAIGTTYGAGDGSTTFVAGPDMRGVVPRGWDDGRGLDGGRGFGSYQADAVQDHYHLASSSTNGSHSHYIGSRGKDGNGASIGADFSYSGYGGIDNYPNTGAAGDHAHTITVGGMANGRIAVETRVKNVALLACIKY